MYDRIYYAKKLYDQILVGKIDRFPHELFEYGVITNEKTALEVIRYSFEYYMRWKPEEIQQISLELLKKLSLDSLLSYIDFPDGIKNKKESLVYLLSILYPNKYSYSFEERTIDMLKDVLEETDQKFPRNWFFGVQGKQRLCICLNYIITQYVSVESIEALYAFFSKKGIVSFLQKYKLYSHQRRIYDTPVDFLHDMLDDSQKSLFLHDYYKFMYLLKK